MDLFLGFTAFLHIFQEVSFCLSTLIGFILSRMHGIFKELFIILSGFPFLFPHHLTVFFQLIRIVVLWVACEELTAFTFSFFHNFRSQFARQLSGFSQNHVPDIVGNHSPAFLAFFQLNDIHHGQVLHILAERSYQTRIPHTRPYVCYLIKQFNQQFILSHERQIAFCLILVDRFQVSIQIGHQATHHTTRKSRSNQQRVHQTVFRTDIQSQEIIHKFLNQGTYLHIGLHIDFRHLEAGVLQHGLYTDHVCMSGTP